jgi:glycerol-3-phosphate cytidylyltransferase
MPNKIIGYTTGVYDMFHIGHLMLLKKAKLHCDYLIVGVSSDELVQNYKKKLPIIPLKDRLEIIQALSCVDEVVIQSDRNKLKAFHEVGFNVMFVGDDWKGDPLWEELERELEKYDARVEYFQYTNKVSSTKFTEILQTLHDEGKDF